MFCSKCGTKALDDALFCQKCGAKLMVEASAVHRGAEINTAYVYKSDSAPAKENPKKKSRKLTVICGVAVLVVVIVLAVIFIAVNWEGDVDYEASVRAHTPFADSQGLPYTYGEVFDKYILDAKWDVRESGDEALVNIRGKAKGTEEKISIIVKASPYEPDPDLLLITTRSVTINGNKSDTQDEAVRYILAMFAAYDGGADDFSDYVGKQNSRGLDSHNAEASGNAADEAKAMKAYAQKVKSLASGDSDMQFALIDLTKSDILELVADSGSEISVYTWADGEAVPIMERVGHGLPTKTGSYSYLPGQEIIRHTYAGMAGAVGYEDYYGINSEHELTEPLMDSLSVWAFKDANWDGIPDEEPTGSYYYVGDTEVTEDVYESYRIQGDFEWLHGDKSAKEILSILEK